MHSGVPGNSPSLGTFHFLEVLHKNHIVQQVTIIRRTFVPALRASNLVVKWYNYDFNVHNYSLSLTGVCDYSALRFNYLFIFIKVVNI
jgi:hypothetical protein